MMSQRAVPGRGSDKAHRRHVPGSGPTGVAGAGGGGGEPNIHTGGTCPSAGSPESLVSCIE